MLIKHDLDVNYILSDTPAIHPCTLMVDSRGLAKLLEIKKNQHPYRDITLSR